jgi:hypothetical protein
MFPAMECSYEQRQAIVLLNTYEAARQESQRGYKAYRPTTETEELLQTPIFKQCLCVSNWLCEKGFSPTYKETHWSGYVEHVFKEFHPRIPMAGQLKNERLLKDYLRSAPEFEPIQDTTKSMAKIYSKVLCKEVLDDVVLLTALGLEEAIYVRPRRGSQMANGTPTANRDSRGTVSKTPH